MNIGVSMMAVRDNENNGNSPFLLIDAVDQKRSISSLTYFGLQRSVSTVYSNQGFRRQGVSVRNSNGSITTAPTTSLQIFY